MSSSVQLILDAETLLGSSDLSFLKIKEFYLSFLDLVQQSTNNQNEFLHVSLFSALWAALPKPFELTEENLTKKIPEDLEILKTGNVYTSLEKFIDPNVKSQQAIFDITYDPAAPLTVFIHSLPAKELEEITEVVLGVWVKLCRRIILNKSTCNKLICNLSLNQFMRLIQAFLTYMTNEKIVYTCCSLFMVLASDNAYYQEYIGKVLAFDVEVFNLIVKKEREEQQKLAPQLTAEEVEAEMKKVEDEAEAAAAAAENGEKPEEEEEERIILEVPSSIYHKIFSLYPENEEVLNMTCRTLRNLSINDETASYLVTACNASQCLNDFLKLYVKKNKKNSTETPFSLDLLESMLYSLINLSYDANISLILGSEGLCMNLVDVMNTFKDSFIDVKLAKLNAGETLSQADRDAIQVELGLINCFLWLLKNILNHNQNLRLLKFTTVIDVLISFRLYYGALNDQNEPLTAKNYEEDINQIYEELTSSPNFQEKSTKFLTIQQNNFNKINSQIKKGENFVDYEFLESYLSVLSGLLNQGELGHEFISNLSLNYVDFFVFLYKNHIVHFQELTQRGPLIESLLFSLYNLIHNSIVVVPIKKIKKTNNNSEELSKNNELKNKIKEKILSENSENLENFDENFDENFKIVEEIEYENESNPTAVSAETDTQTPEFAFHHSDRLKCLFSVLTSFIHESLVSFHHLEAMSELLSALVHVLADGCPYNIALFQSYNTLLPLCQSLNAHKDVPETVVKLWKTILVLINFKKTLYFAVYKNKDSYEDSYKANLKAFLSTISSSVEASPFAALRGATLVSVIRAHKDYGEVWSFGLHLLLSLHPYTEEQLDHIVEKGYLKRKEDGAFDVNLTGEPDLVEKAFLFDEIAAQS